MYMHMYMHMHIAHLNRMCCVCSMYVHAQLCKYMYMHAHVHVCTHIFTYTHVYILSDAQENKKLSEPLTRALKEVEKLRHELANYQKDKMCVCCPW